MMRDHERLLCQYGARRLRAHIKSFSAEIVGVRARTDPESVHRMRVASRKLRSALPIFSFCFPKKQFRGWMKDLKRITRALGDARDMDVQIAYLDSQRSILPRDSRENAGIDRVGMYLLDYRRREQQTILSALDKLEKRNVLENLSATMAEAGRSRLRGNTAGGSKKPVARFAAFHIRNALDHLRSFDGAIHEPLDVDGHHAVRLAAKRLRYTLELFRPLWPDRLKPAIKSLKRLQELLGEVHDCDVWIVLLSGLINPEKTGSGKERFFKDFVVSEDEEPGVRALLNGRQRRREEFYNQLVREWDTVFSGPLLENLRPVVISATAVERSSLVQPSDTGQDPVGKDLGAFGGLYPEGRDHALQVTRLALQLFDGLVDLHGYGNKERSLLEYAGLLHDIGWVGGRNGHHTRSGRMILSDRTLPISSRERAIIALVARYHRKSVPEKPDPGVSGLKSQDRRCILVLASLLRVADGLDYTHASRVASLTCTIAPDTVTCIPVYDGAGGVERSRALAKADLFAGIFHRRFVIP